MTFFPKLPRVNQSSEREPNPMPQPVYLYLYRSAFLVSHADPNKKLPKEKSALKLLIVELECKKYIHLLFF